MAKVRMSRSWGKLGLFLLMLCFVVIRPRTASDPVLPVQSGQSPSAQGTMVSGQVSPFSGTYSTSIPVDVLPGRNGLQPAMAISYASTNADGIAGVGWGIPSSSITRTGPDKGAPTYQDGDEFYMSLNGSGVQLMPVPPESGQPADIRVFHTRVESWSKVVAHYLSDNDEANNPVLTNQVEYWDVWSKSGERYYFGPLPAPIVPSNDTASDYCLDFVDLSAPVGYQKRRNQWMLRKVVDVDGNTMEYSYCQGTQDSQGNWLSARSFLPSLIKYGANDSLGYPHFAGVKFEYEARPDKRFSYRNGAEQDSGDRLVAITAGPLSGGGTDVPYGSDAKKITLAYVTSRNTGRSLLAQVNIAGKNNQGQETALAKPIQFKYADYLSAPMAWADGSGQYSAGAVLQGKPFSEGFYKYGADDTSFGGAIPDGTMLLDINGDGLPDKIDSFHAEDCVVGKVEDTRRIYLNPGPQGGSWTQVSNPSIPGQPIGYYHSCNQYQHGGIDLGVRFADVNGDGIPDKIDSGTYSWGVSNSVYLGRKDGTGWDPHQAGAIHHVAPQILTNGALAFRGGVDLGTQRRKLPTSPANIAGASSAKSTPNIQPNLLPPGGEPPPCNSVSAQFLMTPPSSTAGGRVYFFWRAMGCCGQLDNEMAVSVTYQLQGVDSAWLSSSAGIHYAKYTNIPVGSYTFHVKVTNGGCGKTKQIDYPFTVVSSADHVPPAVAFTQVPQDGFNDTLDFAWAGTDTDDHGNSTALPTFQYRLISYAISGTGTSASIDTANIYAGGSMIVMAYDGAGNMTPIEWAFDGGKLRPPVANVRVTADPSGVLNCQEQGVIYADVNGDGYADVVSATYYASNNLTSRAVWLFDPRSEAWVYSPGFSATVPPIVVQNSDGSTEDTGWRLADMNGDGLPDWVYSHTYNICTAGPWGPICHGCNGQPFCTETHLLLNTGHGWIDGGATGLGALPGNSFWDYQYIGQSGGQPMNIKRDEGAWLLDINGDGLPDKVDGWYECGDCYACGAPYSCATTDCGPRPGHTLRQLWLNTGTGFAPSQGLAPYQSPPPGTVFPGNAFSEAFITTIQCGYPKTLSSRDTGVRVTDLNGDGLPDFVQSYNFTSYDQNGNGSTCYKPRQVHMAMPQNAQSPRLDYLIEVDNPIGGKTSIYYKAAADSYTPNTPGNPNGDYNPGVPYVVDHVTTDSGLVQSNGVAASYTTWYAYAHPKWDVDEHQFAGFREVTVTGPDGVKSVTTYHQDFPLTGMVEDVQTFGAGDTTPFQESSTSYEATENSDGTGVWHVHKLSDRTTVTENGQSLTTGVDYSDFDAYDNVGKVITLGDVSKSDDDKAVLTTYISQMSSDRWLLGFVKQAATYGKDSGGTWQLTSSKHIYYDNLGYGGITKGHPTMETDWLNTENNYIVTSTVAYNGDGTIASRTDSMNIQTTFENYDPTHRFPMKKTVHGLNGGLYATTVNLMDGWGHPLSVTDAKSVKTETAYDGLSRPVSESVTYCGTGPFTTKKYFYHDELMGQPNAQYAETLTYLPNNGNGLSSKAYYDGLGRTYKTDSPGWQNNRIATETLFDAYGRVDKKSRPHFASTPIQWVSYAYDNRSRVTDEFGFGGVTHTDYLSFFESLVTVTGTPSDGVPHSHDAHTKHTWADAYGRLVEVQHDSMPPVYYQYDVMGSLIAAHEGSSDGTALVHLTYDSWGHKLTYQDYDAGIPTTLTTYTYDHQGRLIKQVESVSADASKWRQTVLVYGGDLGQLTSRVGTDDTGAAPLAEALAYYGANQLLNTGELMTRDDASGHSAFSAVFGSDPVTSVPSVITTTTVTTTLGGQYATYSFTGIKDWAGRATGGTLPTTPAGQESVRYAYDGGSGLPVSVSDGTGAVLANYDDYDESHLKHWSRANGVWTRYTHDGPTDRLIGIESALGRHVDSQALSYQFYGDGQVAAVLDSSNAQPQFSQQFTYDDSMRLSGASGPYGSLQFAYDPEGTVAGGPRLIAKGNFTKDAQGVIHNGVTNLLYGSSYKHRVTGTSDGRQYQYDSWGEVSLEHYPDGHEISYTYDGWGRMVQTSTRKDASSAWTLLAQYTYSASGERFRGVTYDANGQNPLEHLFLGGYEVEQTGVGVVRERWAITGPNGLIAWKQQMSGLQAHLDAVNQRGEYALASIAWNKVKNDFTTETLRRGEGQTVLGLKIETPWAAVVGGLSRARLGFEASKDLWAALSHGAKGFGYDEAAQAQAARVALLLMGVMLLLIVSSRKVRRGLASQLRRGMTPPLLRRLIRRGAFEGTLEGPQPLGPWTSPALRLAAKVLILVFVFQGMVFLVPVSAQAQASPCSETFYPLADSLGSVNTLTDSTGGVVLTQHFLPFGEDFEAPKPPVTNCNNSKPWPYGFTGQYHDAETSLIYFHARYYNPAIGHFMSADSVVPNPNDTYSYDRYAYCRNNPVNLTDPSGHNPLLALLAIAAIFAASTFVASIVSGASVGQSFQSAAISFGSTMLFGPIFGPIVSAGIEASMHGGNVLRAMLIAGASMVIGVGVGQAVGAAAANMSTAAQGFLNVLSSGIVGGAISSAMGGDFWRGFASAAAAAGVSIAGNEIAGEINNAASAQSESQSDSSSIQIRHYKEGEGWSDATKVTSTNRFVNGIRNSLKKAQNISVKEMAKMGVTEFDLVHIPTKGFFGDLARAAADKMGFTTPTARELAGIIRQAGPGHWYCHSYGGVAFAEAVRTIGAAGGSLSGQSVTFLAGANNRFVTHYIMQSAGVTVSGYTGNWLDPVPNVIGLNSMNPFQWILDIFTTPFLFTHLSPHTYPPVR